MITSTKQWSLISKLRGPWAGQSFYTIQIIANSLIGYLFNRTLAFHFGTSAEKSGFDIAFNVPFVIMSVSGFTFLYAVVATSFSRMVANKSGDVDAVFSSLLNAMLALSFILAAVGALFSTTLTELLAPGLPRDVKNETATLLVWMLPLVFTLGISTYFGSIFTAYRVPITAELALLTSRLGVIALAFLFPHAFTLRQIAYVLVVCSLLTLVGEWVILMRSTGLRYRFVFTWHVHELRLLGKQVLWFVGVALAAQFNTTYVQRLATIAGSSTTAALSYGFSLVTPLGLLLGKSLSFASGPRYIKLVEQKEYEAALRLITRYLLLCLAITILLVVVISANFEQLLSILYSGGQFDQHSIAETAKLTRPIIWVLPGQAIMWVALFPLLNKGTAHVAAVIYIIGYVFQILLNASLFPQMGSEILSWGFSVSNTVQALLSLIFIFYLLRQHSVTSENDQNVVYRP